MLIGNDYAQTKTKQEYRSAVQGQYPEELNRSINTYEPEK
jgi:hypothetical protein